MSGQFRQLSLFVSILWLAGCGNSPPVHFYTLSAEAAFDSNAPAKDNRLIAIGPITMPEVIERPQFVLRTGPNQVTLVEDHQWAEPLQSDILRVLAENLSRLLRTPQVVVYPQKASDHADYRVAIDVQQFESIHGQKVSLSLRWTIRQVSRSETPSKTGLSRIEEPVHNSSYEALAAAHSRALARVSIEIAEALQLMPPKHSE